MNPYQLIVDKLRASDIQFDELDHEPIYTTEEAAQVHGLSLDAGAKSLLLKTKEGFLLVVLAGSRKLDSKKLKKLLGIKDIRFASPAEVKDTLGCIVGACYPLGSVAGVPTYLDNSLLSQEVISFNPGLHDKTIKVKLGDYLTVEQPQQVDVSVEV